MKSLCRCLCLLLAIFTIVEGICFQDGVLIKNNASWQTDPCTSCSCIDGFVTCEVKRCKDPRCDATKGESLIFPANKCCPVCTAAFQRHCEVNGDVVAHNTEWRYDNCTRCKCNDGLVTCTLTECRQLQCGYGEVEKKLPTQCCPICVSTEESCTYEGKTHRDGEWWSPSKCERAFCSRGGVVRLVAQCKSMVCKPGETAMLLEDDCCPTCVGRSCAHQNIEYASGQQFEVDSCQTCVCWDGHVTCRRKECAVDRVDSGCPEGERKVVRKGECCASCVSLSQPCVYNNTRYYHGDIWEVSKCQAAVCINGSVRSHFVQCSTVECKSNEKLVHTSCCPKCIPTIEMCRHNGYEYRNGDVWQEERCTRCECLRGKVQCFTTECPRCPPRTVPINVPGECCPECQLVTCHSDCSSCDAPGYGHCTSCKLGRLLQEGKCVRRCQPGFFQDGLRCLPCHPSCSTCQIGYSPSTCTSCPSGHYLQEGRCVKSCDNGFYRDGRQCRECKRSCSVCASSNKCLKCKDSSTILQENDCVVTCAKGFYFTNNTCTACHHSCETCSGYDDHCLTCRSGMLVEKTKCVERCSRGYYQLSISRCAACHKSCASCSGPSDRNCLSCGPGSGLYRGQCLPQCPVTYFRDINGKCKACHESCHSCIGPTPNDCTSCSTSRYVIQPISGGSVASGRCVSRCRPSRYLDENICKACNTTCASCTSTTSCSSCKPQRYLLAEYDGKGTVCLSEDECIQMDFITEHGRCLRRNFLASCPENQAYYNGGCVDSCPKGTFLTVIGSKSMCERCSDNCVQCTSSTECDKCSEGRLLSKLSGTCVETCEPGYYPSFNTGACEACPSTCKTCRVTEKSARPQCLSCRQPQLVIQNGRCTSTCAQQFYPAWSANTSGTAVCEECDWSCVRCTGPSSSDCVECMPGFKIQQGSCVRECSDGFYLSRDNCLPCSPGCASCKRTDQCSACRHPYVLHGNRCLSACPRSYFADSTTSRCSPCPVHCLQCVDGETCLQCDNRTFLLPPINDFDGVAGNSEAISKPGARCVTKCGRGRYGNKESRVCVENGHAPLLKMNGQVTLGIGSRSLVDVIRVTDEDSDPSELRLILKMDASNGWFEINNTRITVGTKVPYQKVLRGNLWFIHESVHQRYGEATFQATDGHLSSDLQTLPIAVVSEIAPRVSQNGPLVVRSGEVAKISHSAYLNVEDEDNAYDVTISIVHPPQYGHVIKLPNFDRSIKSFKVLDLQNDDIAFVPHSSGANKNVLYDVLSLQIDDKFHVINTVLHINILPRGNDSVMMINNKRIRVVRGGVAQIDNQHLLLEASNVKDPSKIIYVLSKSEAQKGELVLMVPELSDAPVQRGLSMDDWIRTSEGHYRSRPLTRFSQRDIDEGLVWLRYNSEADEEDDMETFEFEVFDESLDPVKSIARDELTIAVVKKNEARPHLARGLASPLRMFAHEGRMTVLHSGYLHYTDDDTPDRDLVFNITRSLPPSYGALEHADHPHVPITVFTQADVDANKIMYRPPIGGILSVTYDLSYGDLDYQRDEQSRYQAFASERPTIPEFEFGFTVSDGEHTSPSANFTITLTSGESDPPAFINQSPYIEVHAGESTTIGTQQLGVHDPDTPSHNLIFTLVKAPRHGTVVRNIDGTGMVLQEEDAFTYDELRSDSLQYVHDGDEEQITDQLQVSVTDGTYTVTKVIQVSLKKEESDILFPEPQSELSLATVEGSVSTLTRENLAYESQEYSAKYIVYQLESVPTHGLLEMNGPCVPGSTFTQDDIDKGRVSFRSLAGVGAEALVDMVHFHVSIPSGDRLPDQVLTITIKPAPHKPPSIFVGEPLVVQGGQEAMLTPRELVVVDADSEERDLIVRLIRRPSLGHMLNTLAEIEPSEEDEDEFWFTVRHLLDGGIFYVQTRERQFDETEDYFTFQVTDGYTTSTTYRLNITIQTPIQRGNQPRLRTNVIECRNGQAIIIQNGSVSVTDPDTPNRLLVFTIVSQLNYGRLMKFDETPGIDMPTQWDVSSMEMKEKSGMVKKSSRSEVRVGSSFTYQDILDHKICYESVAARDVTVNRRRRDTLDFTLSDGYNVEEGQLMFDVRPGNVKILNPPTYEPLDDGGEKLLDDRGEAELVAHRFVMEANTGITVERGSVTIIGPDQLRVTSPGQVISYAVTRDPNVGQLQLAKNNQVLNVSSSSRHKFTQRDIDNGYFRYYHPMAEGGGDVFFMFDVIEGPSNLRFDIHVNEDRIPPIILTNNGLTVEEGSTAKITSQHLSASDDSGRIFYEITQAPKWGRIELVSSPGHAILGFSQDDVASGKVQYVNVPGSERSEDQFALRITDGTNSVTQTFYITVTPIDNSLPLLENTGIRVQEGVRKTITEFELKATDRDTTASSITFHVVVTPQHGAVERTTSGKRHVPVTSFTMEDIYQSKVSYNHDGTNSLADSFTFTVSDGTNQQFMISEEDDVTRTTDPQTFHIEVVPVDDGTPRIVTNLGLSHLENTDNKAMNVLTKRVLLTEDPDTPPDLIFYTITSEPRHGHLESSLDSGTAIKMFTQADVNMGTVRYVLDRIPEEETRDSFMFNVRDSLPNVVTGNTFNIRWSVISFEKQNYKVSEEEDAVDIPVLRRGNLNQYAIVLCRTESGTATSSSEGGNPRSGSVDFLEHAGQVQFDEGDAEKICSVQIRDDQTYEDVESFTVELSMPTYALLGPVTRTTVYVNDSSDMPTLQFVETQHTVEERDTFVFIPIKRTGDLEKPVTVVCFTEPGTASGSAGDRIESGSDYRSRSRSSASSVVTFAPGVATVTCDVKIVDDSLYEDAEEFVVRIEEASQGAKIGKFSKATVTITGPNDAPTVFLTDTKFVFSENSGTVDIPVRRVGSDLSGPTDVWCSTKQNDPVSAVAGEDFVAISTKITFRNEETAKICSLTILDDSQSPSVEGNETFLVYLNSVQTAQLAPPSEALVVINDTLDDVPRFEFAESTLTVKEDAGIISVPIHRFGDVSGRSSVICFTRQDTALAEGDFTERSLTETSRITFEAGQSLNFCNVSITDDGIYEPRESFSVWLSSASSDQWYGARVGENNQVRIAITNHEDAPTLQFERAEYSIREPDSSEGSRQLTVRVIRTGDVSETSKVRCSTRDGSAKSGSDYEPKSRMLRFQPGQTSAKFKVNILSNEDTEWHETFLVVLGPHDPVNAVLGANSQSTVTILDKDAAGSLVLPSTPVVVSLMHYDDVATGMQEDPSPGYPLVCVTPCDPKYPEYVDTQSLCEEAAINASAIKFRWEVAMPTEEENGIPPFETITDNTPFTSVNTKVLDSIYYGRRFHVRCVAQAVDSVTRTDGTPLRSNVVTIATDSGICHNPVVSGSPWNLQAQSFVANLRYVPPDSIHHPNTLHVSVKVPHQDGRLPLVSTAQLNNVKLLLSRSIDRRQHVCSNLVSARDEVAGKNALRPNLGFIEATEYSKLSFGPGYDKPYQFDPTVREEKTIDLYKYLNLKSCMWQFDAYYHMNELIDFCYGKVDTDFQLRDSAESQITVTVPLYVSYIFVTAPRGWGTFEHNTDMQFSFRYSNILWRSGISTEGAPSGRIQVIRIKLRDDGKLVVDFKTQAKFRGLFVLSHRTLPGRASRVVAPDGMNIGFDLSLTHSEKTYDSPYQQWRAVSTYSRKDYSGDYTVELIPCTVASTQKWEEFHAGKQLPCTAFSPDRFTIPITFQQTNRPVPVVYTLQTEFQLCNNEKLFMVDPHADDVDMNELDYKGAFTKGQTLFGRVLWAPEQDLSTAYRLGLEKVYLCTGKDGYVPYYDPTGAVYGDGPQYGCIEPSSNLQHRFVLLDRSNRDAEERFFHDVPFHAYFSSDRSEFKSMQDISGVDGFLMKVDALYKVEAGHQWYIQVVYAISSDEALQRVRRSVLFGLSSVHVQKRAASDWSQGSESQNGTNMRGILIDRTEIPEGVNVAVISAVAGGIALACLVLAACCCCFCCRRRRGAEKEKSFAREEIAMVEGDNYDDDDDDDVCSSPRATNRAKAKKINDVLEKNSQIDRVRVSNLNEKTSSAPLIVPCNLPPANNMRTGAEKPLLKRSRKKALDHQIVNDLNSEVDCGTEV